MRSSIFILTGLALAVLSGCGGSPSATGSSLTGMESVQTIGSLVTRVVGTAQPPVVAGGKGVVVTGLAGATISSLSQFEDQTQTQTRILIGPSGILGANAAGILVGQQGKTIPCVVAFDTQTAATRANARISTTTGIAPELPNILFTVTAADAITSLRYINGPGTTGVVTAIGPGGPVTTASGAILTFDSAAGTLVNAIPYVANRSAGSAPATERSGDVLIVRGRFPAILDSAGRNLAPNGAARVSIEAKTGKLLDWK